MLCHHHNILESVAFYLALPFQEGSFPWCKMTLNIYIFQINITVFIFDMIVDHWIYFVFKVLLGQVLLVGESGPQVWTWTRIRTQIDIYKYYMDIAGEIFGI